jgi:L-fuculose-phosphate aldolase
MRRVDDPRSDRSLREELIAACRDISRQGLSHGTSGNVSVRRDARHFFISPTGMEYTRLEPEDIPLMDFAGRWFGRCRPSSEWRFHRDILASRPDADAIVHTHSRYATALACAHRGIPAFHYMVALSGAPEIPCAPYHPFGSQALSDAALAALEQRRACLLANHGVIALGTDLRTAFALAGEVENLAAQYCATLAIGEPHLLDRAQMAEVLAKFRTYGQQHGTDPALQFAGAALPGTADLRGT